MTAIIKQEECRLDMLGRFKQMLEESQDQTARALALVREGQERQNKMLLIIATQKKLITTQEARIAFLEREIKQNERVALQ